MVRGDCEGVMVTVMGKKGFLWEIKNGFFLDFFAKMLEMIC